MIAFRYTHNKQRKRQRIRHCWCNMRVREYTGRFKGAVIERLRRLLRCCRLYGSIRGAWVLYTTWPFGLKGQGFRLFLYFPEACRMRTLRSHAFTFVDYIPPPSLSQPQSYFLVVVVVLYFTSSPRGTYLMEKREYFIFSIFFLES